MPAPYLQQDLKLSVGGVNDPAAVRALQHDLRALGYLRAGINGVFGNGTTAAIRSLQFDLLHNTGIGTDGRAPVALTTFNAKPGGGQYVVGVTGLFDQDFAMALTAIAADPRVGKLPSSTDPTADNARAVAAIRLSGNTKAPPPYILAMAAQESDCQHFRVPRPGDDDSYVVVGLDRNDDASSDHITSRGVGLGQFTFFHHPLSPQEVADTVADPVRNVQHAFEELREKFDHSVVGADAADDRTVEHPRLPLRICRYQPGDTRYLNDCKTCASQTRRVDIVRGTPAYQGASISYQPTTYYPSAIYPSAPDRADFLCDWPYAARRYNGGGVNSFHYQARILLNLLR